MNLYRYRRILALAAAGAVAAVGFGAAEKPSPPMTEIIYTVNEGDTLWQIADSYIDDEENIQEFIYELKRNNPHLEEYLQPGQQIKIGIKKELADIGVSANSQNFK
ncbi:LysM peptidoglycan-binding domain-containing protein [Megamonas hypermegale]|uniref:LysM peptidoglycan-binding domain-containing protein n=1 Tax=Megamonas hypermegale TaxID=158847 RepID=UPI0026EADCDC|nr:LysM domain-containing protein [Megamonas hypermegale]